MLYENLDVEKMFDYLDRFGDLLDSVKRRMENERASAAYAMLKKQLEDVDAEINRIDDTLQMYMEHGVFEFEGQSERVMQQYAIAVAQGNTAAMQRLSAELEKLATWGPRAHALYEVQFNFRKYQSLVKQKMMDTSGQSRRDSGTLSYDYGGKV